MAVPKKKKSKAKTRSRRASAWTLSAPGLGTCARCGQPKMSHRACPSCGTYRGRQVIEA